MSRITNPEALAHLEKRMVDTFGVAHTEYDGGIAVHPVPRAHFNAAIRLTDTSGIVPLLNEWDSERRKSNAGKKPLIPLRALVVIYLLNTQMGVGVTYGELARTLTYRFTSEHFAALGIRTTEGDVLHWYKRVSETTYRLIALMNPRPTPLRRILNAEQFQDLLTRMARPAARTLSERNQNRLDTFCNLLVQASYHFLPKDLRQQYKGNIAIDATKVLIPGRRNSSSKSGSRSNADPLSGRYTRLGNHEGTGSGTDEAAYELETAVMVWNKPGENMRVPSLVTAISCHTPGALVGHAADLATLQRDLGFVHFTVIVDRAYNGESIETFHKRMAELEVDVVFDYKADDLGIQSHFEDLILVDGSWYVNWMPEGLVDASKELAKIEKARDVAQIIVYKAEHPNKRWKGPTDYEVLSATQVLAEGTEALPNVQERINLREPYRMIPKGRRDKDGHQRFTYPPLGKMLRQPKVPPALTSITVPPVLPIDGKVASGGRSSRKSRAEVSKNTRQKSQPIKFAQTYPHKSAKWRAYYGMRSIVEASNNLLKSAPHGDIANKRKRSGRGYAAIYLSLAFAVATSNLQRIVSFFVAEATRIQLASKKHRSRRRKDELGRPLQKRPHAQPPEILA